MSSGATPSASSRAISPPIASASPRSPPHSSSASRRPARPAAPPISNRPRSSSRRVALAGVAGVEAELHLLRRAPSSRAQLGEKLRPRRERLAVGVVDGDRDLAGAGERREQLELLVGEVVESVDQYGPRRPGVGPLAQALGRRARSAEWTSSRPAGLDAARRRPRTAPRARPRSRRRPGSRRRGPARRGRPGRPAARRSGARAPARTPGAAPSR